jgi:sugar phosphate permease
MSSDAKESKKKYYFGWNVVIAVVLAQVAYFEHLSSAIGLFMKPLQDKFHWSRASIGGVQSTGRMVEGLAAPLIGPLLDRYGARVVMPIGGIIVTFSMLAMSKATNIWELYLLRGILAGLGFTLIGDMVNSVVISKWFVRKRGRALGFARAANAGTGIVLMPVAVYVIVGMGWQKGFGFYGILALIFAVLPPIFLMRRSPEDLGLHPDGIDPEDVNASLAIDPKEQKKIELRKRIEAHVPPDRVWGRVEVLKNGTFWLICAAYVVTAMSYQAINVSMPAYIQDLGYGKAALATIMSANFLIESSTAFLFGFVAEYAYKRGVRMAPMLLQCLGVFLLLFGKNPVCLWAAVVLYRTGLSSVQIMQEVIWGNYFGRPSLGMVRSIAYFVVFVPASMGPVFLNMVYDALGSYNLGFIVLAVLFVFSAVLVGVAQPPKPKQQLKIEAMATS